jgi:pyrimidine-nucleoside phosphorylase
MGQPLGREVGNANEIRESVEVLSGRGPEDVIELTLAFAEVMMEIAGIEGGRERLKQAIDSGAALEKLVEVAVAQGGDPSVIENPDLLPTCADEAILTANRSGFVTRCDALTVGVAATRLGAGRDRKEDDIDPGVGITIEAKMGDTVSTGDILARVRYSDPAKWEAQRDLLASAWVIEDIPPEPQDLIIERIEAGN